MRSDNLFFMKAFFTILPVVFFMACAEQGEDGTNSTFDGTGSSDQYAAGEKVYMGSCVACHQKNGEGLVGAFPPLAHSDYLLADKYRAITVVANGMSGEITVNGEIYNENMASQGLSDEQVKDVVNYILNSWGNSGGEVTDADVASALGR